MEDPEAKSVIKRLKKNIVMNDQEKMNYSRRLNLKADGYNKRNSKEISGRGYLVFKIKNLVAGVQRRLMNSGGRGGLRNKKECKGRWGGGV